MKKLLFIGKLVLIVVFGLLAGLSVMMFPALIGSEDVETATIGYGYLVCLVVSLGIVYGLVRKDLRMG